MCHGFWRVIGPLLSVQIPQHILEVADRKLNIGPRLWASRRLAAKNEGAIPTAVVLVKGRHGPDVPDISPYRSDQQPLDAWAPHVSPLNEGVLLKDMSRKHKSPIFIVTYSTDIM